MKHLFDVVSNFLFDIATFQYKKPHVIVSYLALAALAAFVVLRGDAIPTAEVVTTLAEVSVQSVRALVSDSSFTAVGAVSAISEARLQTESGGRVTAVNVSLGDTVAAGTVLARLESAVESAALLQAQGAYEAAIAGAAQSGVGVNEAQNGLLHAQNGAVSTYKNAYTTVSGAVFGTLDQFFGNPNSQIPGVRLGSAYTASLNTARVKLQSTLPTWQVKTLSLRSSGDLETSLKEAEVNTKSVLVMTDSFIAIVASEKNNGRYTDAELKAFGASLNTLRGQLVGVLTGIDAARTGLTAAADAVSRAKIAGSGSVISGADAQIKIALGSLRAAQANYGKTLVQTPIRGVVNALYLKTGEYAAPSAPAAIVANNGSGLEISTSVSQEDSAKVAIGDRVTIDTTSTGTIAAIAGAIDPTTGKVALKISVADESSLKNGSTVSVLFTLSAVKEITDITVPLSAIKMTGSGPVVFTVSGEQTLSPIPVVLGAISGENVVITEGVTLDSLIVVDARGLKAGEKVTMATK